MLVNTAVFDMQSAPALTRLDGGNLVAVWRSNANLGDIEAQVFDANGNKARGEVRINKDPAGEQNVPATASLAGGGFAIAWEDATARAIKGQMFDASGNRVGGEFAISIAGATSRSYYIVRGITLTRVGAGLAISWRVNNLETQGSAINTALVTGGGAVGAVTQVDRSTSTVNGSDLPRLLASATLTDGRYVLSWAVEAGSLLVTRARVFNVDGQPAGPSIETGAAMSVQNAILALPDGGFLIARATATATTSGIKLQRYDATGAASGTEVSVGAGQINAMALLSDGRVAIAFDVPEQRGAGARDIYVATYTLGGQVSALALANQARPPSAVPAIYTDQTAPAVQAMTNGRFFVIWADTNEYSTDGDTDGSIKARLFAG